MLSGFLLIAKLNEILKPENPFLRNRPMEKGRKRYCRQVKKRN
jgi:hypothetical protein